MYFTLYTVALEALWSLKECSTSISAPSIDGGYFILYHCVLPVPDFLPLQKEVAIKAISDPNSEQGKVQF